MRAFAADIRHRQNDVRRQFMLNIQVPLLHVRPHGLARNGERIQGKQRASADAGIATGRSRAPCGTCSANIRLRGSEDQRRRSFERFGVAFVTVGVFEKDAVTAANRGLAVTFGIKREADARSRVEEMAFETAVIRRGSDCRSWKGRKNTRRYGTGSSLSAALHNAVEWIARAGNQ